MTESVKARINTGLRPSRDTYELYQLLVAVQADIASLVAQFNQLRTDFNAHSHGGVTTGAGATSVVTASTSTAVTLQTNA